MDALLRRIEQADRRKTIPDFRVGDVLKIHQRIREGGKERIQIFEGLVIAKKHGTGLNGTFTVRRIASGVGVERVYPIHTPTIAKIERVRTSKVRRAKLYFLRGRVGKKARLKTIDAYTAWEETPETDVIPEDSAADLTVPATDEASEVVDQASPETNETTESTPEVDDGPLSETEPVGDEDVATQPSGESVESDTAKEQAADDTRASANGESGGESGNPATETEGSQDTPEESQK